MREIEGNKLISETVVEEFATNAAECELYQDKIRQILETDNLSDDERKEIQQSLDAVTEAADAIGSIVSILQKCPYVEVNPN